MLNLEDMNTNQLARGFPPSLICVSGTWATHDHQTGLEGQG